MKNLLLLTFSLLISTFSFANDDFEIHLKSGNFTPEVTTDFEKAIQPLFSEKNQASVYRIIQFYSIPTNKEKQAIANAGLELINYIPNKAFICKVANNASISDFKTLKIRSILLIESSFKIAKSLTKTDLPEWALTGDEILLNIKYYSETDRLAVINSIEEGDGEILECIEKINVLTIQYASDKIIDLAENPMIQWVGPVSPPSAPESNEGKNTTRSNGLNTFYNGGRKYDGSGVTVGLSDDGAIGPHIDFQGRATMHTLLNQGRHGDMTSGILMGAGNLDPTIVGMAPGAEINIYRIGRFIFLSSQEYIINALDNLNNLGTIITSTSYSQGTGGVYNESTEYVDNQVNETPVLTHVFAAGNSGQRDHGYGAGVGWGNISGAMKAGKNVICAGNVDDNDALHITSSRGPAADGRIKPDLCALGGGHMTTDENNTYQVGAGTSAATPAIAGVVAQLYQAYRELNGGEDPESGLIKASLLNTAQDLGNPGPDFQHGWGRINGLKAVRIIEDKRYLDDNIAQGEDKSHVITVPDNVSEVRVMTYWIDVSGSISAAKALVNDINMQVVTPGAETYNPLVLDATPNVASLNADAVQGIDNLNNVEQVIIENPAAGDYTVNLNGFAIPQGPQKYFVLYDFIYDEVELTYPIGGEGFVPGQTERIFWDASKGTESFNLEYSTDGGSTFMTIGTANSTARNFNWIVPNTISNDVKFKISRGNSSSESERTFTIAGVPTGLNIIGVCPDYVEIGWNAVNGVSMYEVSMLGDKYMDSIGVSTTNSFRVTGLNPNEDHWFSVRSLVDEGKGRRAIAINKPPGTENCTLNHDIEMVQILSPLEGGISTCKDLENTTVSLNINNIGLVAAADIELNYQINNGNVVTETLSSNLASGENSDYTFATTANLSGVSSFEIATWASFTTDENYSNDTIRRVIEIFNTNLISSFPYVETFQSFDNCDAGLNCELINCQLSNGWINYRNLDQDQIDWRTDDNGTSTTNTGPDTDYDTGVVGGKYLYLEGSEGCNFREAVLLSPCIDLTTTNCAEFEFAYHMFGNNMGELHVDVISESGEFLDVVNPISGDQGTQWHLLKVDLTPYIGEVINVKIRGFIGNGVRSDIAIDALSFNVGAPVADFSFTLNGNTFDFTDNSSGLVDSYSWDFGDGTTSTEPNPTHNYTTGGNYDVTLIVEGSCGRDTLVQTVGSTNTETIELASAIGVHPNPNNGKFSIQFPNQLVNQQVRINLIDVVGKSVLYFENERSTKNLSIDASDIPAGVYFVEISGEEFGITKKIVKQK